jgi:hypothetical protein
MNYHTLSDFRVACPEFLDDLLTQGVATLKHEGLVTVDRVAQEGIGVRASAGASSFRRRKALEECQAEAKEQVEALAKELEEAPAATDRGDGTDEVAVRAADRSGIARRGTRDAPWFPEAKGGHGVASLYVYVCLRNAEGTVRDGGCRLANGKRPPVAPNGERPGRNICI